MSDADLTLQPRVQRPEHHRLLLSAAARNPYTDSTFLCGAVPSGLVLLLWYEPLQKFMHLKVCTHPQSRVLQTSCANRLQSTTIFSESNHCIVLCFGNGLVWSSVITLSSNHHV